MRVTEIGPVTLTRHLEYSAGGTIVPACLTCTVSILVNTAFDAPDQVFDMRLPTRISANGAEPLAAAETRARQQLAHDLRSIAAALEAQAT